MIEAVRDWLTTSVQLRPGRFEGPTDLEVATAAARALGIDMSGGERLAASLLAGVEVDFCADAGTVTIAVTRESLDCSELNSRPVSEKEQS